MNKDLEKLLENAKLLGAGDDSSVYKSPSGNYVMKLYTNLRIGSHHTAESCLKVLQKYQEDTLKVKRIIETRQKESDRYMSKDVISIQGEAYQISAIIIPQGNPRIIGEEVVAIGQEYIPGPNFESISRKKPSKGFEEFYAPNYEYNEKACFLENWIKYLIQDNYGDVGFCISRCNFKPIIDTDEKKLNLVITDLADWIFSIYFDEFRKFSYHAAPLPGISGSRSDPSAE